MSCLVRPALLRSAQYGASDKIIVKNLEVVVNAGRDAWGREDRKQRALITVTLALAQPFDTAADADALDNSTVHYGVLSKKIQRAAQDQKDWMSTSVLADLVGGQVHELTGDATKGGTRLQSMEIDVCYPKGSMLGEGAGVVQMIEEGNDTNGRSAVLYLRNLRIPCLIGVNANERLQKQPVIVNVCVECVDKTRLDDYPKLETAVVNAISESSFETLEALSTKVVQELRDDFFTESDGGSFIRLRVEKPLAVPFADAPAIEIFRPVKP